MARRTDDPREVYLVLHGHFYQPPRENPYLETIERELGAEPWHDWNERIADECYCRNARTRVFDDAGRIVDIVNNYAWLSFNFGPTLLPWLAEHRPDAYRAVIEADRQSLQRLGHGNAMAQAYNHAILPLCNERDRRTQLRWGIADFRFRFGRAPEAMWLPETAIDQATVEALIDEDLRWVILSPRQALRTRASEQSEWTDVSGGRIDPRRAYRIRSRRPGRPDLAAFFYDGPVAHGMSFEGLLQQSRTLVDRLWGAVDAGRREPQLIHAAVDGETFGHHHAHGDRALGYALTREAPARGFRLLNYGAWLERFAPTHEVELDAGPAGEGTAWSCAHGVGRWIRDCGCRCGCPEHWNQAWRTPLRLAVNLLRDEAATLYEDQGGEALHDVWQARDEYVELLLDGASEKRTRFLEKHRRPASANSAAHQLRVLKLLELQRQSLLAQTSCGWFFDDISGLEARQVLAYLGRGAQLYEELSGRALEPRVLEVLGEAQSNIAAQGTGADVYRHQLRRVAINARRIAAQQAMSDLYEPAPPAEQRRYGYLLRRVWHRQLGEQAPCLRLGRVQLELLRTGECWDLTYALLHFGGHDFHCAVRSFSSTTELRLFVEELERIYERATVTELLRAVDAHFGDAYYGLAQVLPEQRERVLAPVFGGLEESLGQALIQLYEQHRRSINALVDAGLRMPEAFRLAAQYALSRQLDAELSPLDVKRFEAQQYEPIARLIDESRQRGYQIGAEQLRQCLSEQLMRLLHERLHDRALALLELAARLHLALPVEAAQDLLFDQLCADATLGSLDHASHSRLLAQLHLACPTPPEAETP